MPNWCSNCLSIEGDPNTLKEIIGLVKTEKNVFDFERIVPMPDYIYRGNVGLRELELYGENNWYDWSLKNWGTKWNSGDAIQDGCDFYFETAWSPCEPVIEELAKAFPTMRFNYTFFEAGMCFCGKRVYESGRMIFCYDGDYTEDSGFEDDENVLKDNLFTIQNCGINEKVVCEDCYGTYVSGKLYFREYEDNRIYRMTEGHFVASTAYVFEYADKPCMEGKQVA